MKLNYLIFTIEDLPEYMHNNIIRDFRVYVESLKIYSQIEVENLIESIECEKLHQLTDYIDIEKYL